MENFDPTDLVAIDTETTGLQAWLGDKPFAVSMCNRNGETWYCEWPVDPHTRNPTPNPQEVDFVSRVMGDPTVTKVFHNGKFDVRMLEVAYGIKLRGRVEETYFAARACNTIENEYTLKHLAEKYCGVKRDDADLLQEATRKLRPRAKQLGYKIHKDVYADYWLPRHFAQLDRLPIEHPWWNLCKEYAVLDAIRTMMLWFMYQEALKVEEAEHTYRDEIALWQCTYDMETRGVRVAVDICKKEFQRNLHVIEESLNEMQVLAGHMLNPRSPIQLEQVLIKERGLTVDEYTPKGAPSFSFNSIRRITGDAFVHQLQRQRASTKVNRTFLQRYLELAVPDPISPGEMCLHPMFNQAAAQTWRYGCSHPNLQQVVNANGARNAVETMSARMAFGPRTGYTWYHFDYSQLELYLFAGQANEQFMLHHMMSGHDLHSECANKAWGGKGNPAALIKGAVALECEASHPSTENVKRIWEAYGWDPKWVLDQKAKDEFTSWWLNTYGGDNWDIVKAEKALGKKVARTRAKFVMYAKIYGGGPKAIKNFLYCSDDEAREFQREYDLAFPRIKQYLKEQCREAEINGYITNAYGRRIRIPEGYSYKSVNFRIQSDAACLLKSAMLKTYNFVRHCMEDWHLLLTIHDELVFEVRTADIDGMEYGEKKNADGTVNPYYAITDPDNDVVFALNQIKLMMEDHEGRFRVPTPVECARCDERWDVKVGVNL